MLLNASLSRGAVEVLLRAGIAGMLAAQVWALIQFISGRTLLPPIRPRSVPWGGRSLLLVILGYVLLSIVVRTSYELIRVVPESDGRPPAAGPAPAPAPGSIASLTFAETMALVSVVNALSVVAVPLILRATSGATFVDLGMTSENLVRNALAGAVTFFVVTPWVYGVNALALLIFAPSRHPLESMIREGLTPSVVVLAVGSAVVLAPLAEELIFRGVLLGWLGNPNRSAVAAAEDESLAAAAPLPEVGRVGPTVPGDWRAIVASSLPFALVHVTEMPAPFAIFVLSLSLGWLARRTGSLVAPLVLHGMFNGFSTLTLLGAVL